MLLSELSNIVNGQVYVPSDGQVYVVVGLTDGQVYVVASRIPFRAGAEDLQHCGPAIH